jgi:hypothetical protein
MKLNTLFSLVAVTATLAACGGGGGGGDAAPAPTPSPAALETYTFTSSASPTVTFSSVAAGSASVLAGNKFKIINSAGVLGTIAQSDVSGTCGFNISAVTTSIYEVALSTAPCVKKVSFTKGASKAEIIITATAPATTTPTNTTPTSTLAAGAEISPSLGSPQPGSNAAIGGSTEGFYNNFNGFALIDKAGNTWIRDLVGYRTGNITVGPTTRTWSFQGKSLFVSSKPITGTGTISFGSSIDGSTVDAAGTTNTLSLSYDASNALAATTTSLVGSWSATGASISVDSSGLVSGVTSGTTLGSCVLSGDLSQDTPNSLKNMFTFNLRASGNTCNLSTANAYTGRAAIAFDPAGATVANGYYRSIYFILTTTNDAVYSGAFKKQ